MLPRADFAIILWSAMTCSALSCQRQQAGTKVALECVPKIALFLARKSVAITALLLLPCVRETDLRARQGASLLVSPEQGLHCARSSPFQVLFIVKKGGEQNFFRRNMMLCMFLWKFCSRPPHTPPWRYSATRTG